MSNEISWSSYLRAVRDKTHIQTFHDENSGIFSDDGLSITNPTPVVQERSTHAADLSDLLGQRETNADRLRRGLPPLAPTRRLLYRQLRPRASPVPCNLPNTIDKIAISFLSASTNGYVRKTFDGQNSYTKGNLANALQVSIPSSPSAGPFELTALNGPDSAYPFVGAVGGSGGYNMRPGSLGPQLVAIPTYTFELQFICSAAVANSPPSFSAGHSIQRLGYNAPAESTIWYLDCTTLSLTAQWTNTDGSQNPISTFYDGPVDSIDITGDFNAFEAAYPGENAVRVTLKFVPDPI
ncbi:hypothetical protein C8J57DRAFT_1720774 [Mycena rebaudengoi]|nr:hypothetical protein C8J57DRAFT_1720774 [Mycena rebaudengoi]